MSDSKGPARGYSWPPFEKGNAAAVTHGAQSPAKVEPLAAELAAGVVALAPWLAAPEFVHAVRAWGRAEARCELLDRWLAERGPLDEDGKPRPAAEFLIRAERLAGELRRSLGLDPASRARLMRDASDAELNSANRSAVIERGRRALDEAGRTPGEPTHDDKKGGR